MVNNFLLKLCSGMVRLSPNRVTSTFMYDLKDVGLNSKRKFHYLYYSTQSSFLHRLFDSFDILYNENAQNTEAEGVDRAERSAFNRRTYIVIQ